MRIGINVLANNLIAAHAAKASAELPTGGQVGIAHPSLLLADLVESVGEEVGRACQEVYGIRTRVELEGQLDSKVTCVTSHARYIVQELLKNAMRATIESR